MHNWRHRAAAGACVSLLALSFAAHADYKGSYGKALEAYKAGSYAEAKQLLLSAIAEHPEPAARVRLYGTRFEPYLPQHYLGLIAVAQGDCAGAQAAWAMPENALVAQVGDAMGEEKSAAAKCGNVAITQKPSAPAPGPAGAAPKPSEPTVAQKPAAPPATPPDQSKVPTPKVDADKNVVANDSPKPRPGEVEIKPAPPPERPAEKPAAPPAEKAGAPEQLIATFENFLNGNLREVARSNPDAYTDARLRFHAYLVRCGARFTLAQLGDQAQLEPARADARQAHALNAGATPDAWLFSPHFRSFYAENR